MSKVTAFPSTEQEKAAQAAADQKIQKEVIFEYLRVFGYDKTLSDTEIQQFIQTALAGNLDPFKKEIYIAVYGEGEHRKVSILTGYQVYLKRAERTGKLDGWQARVEGNASQMKAIVEIFRKDWSHSFIHEAYWEESVQKKKDGSPTQFWSKQPRFQLRKVAIAQAFRLAFPDELGGLPYESAELPEHSSEHDTSDKDIKPTIPDPSISDLADEALDDSWPFGDNAAIAPIKPAAPTTSSDTQEPDSEQTFLEKAIRQIEGLFEAHPKDFTTKHQAWILDKVYKAADKTGVQKMLAYTEKVIKAAA